MSGFRIPLIVSVLFNVLLVGILVGGIVRFEMSRPRIGGLLAAGRQLPEPERDTLRQGLRAVRREARQTILEGQQARRDAASLLRQPTLDTTALLAALQRARTADVAVRTLLEQRIVEFAATSSPETRLLLAEGLVRHLPAAPVKK